MEHAVHFMRALMQWSSEVLRVISVRMLRGRKDQVEDQVEGVVDEIKLSASSACPQSKLGTVPSAMHRGLSVKSATSLARVLIVKHGEVTRGRGFKSRRRRSARLFHVVAVKDTGGVSAGDQCPNIGGWTECT